ncbi:DUF975 family protein [Streptococcus constellatus]
MSLSELRAEARRIQRQTKGIYALFLVPILTAIISVVYNYSSDTFSNNILQYGIQKTIVHGINRSLFPIAISFIVSFFLTAAFWTLLEVIRGKRQEVHFTDSVRTFDSKVIGPVFMTLLLKRVLLFLWNIFVWIGSGMMILASFSVIKLLPNSQALSQNTALQTTVGTLLLYILIGFILMVIGIIIALPQYYAYSQVEFILCDTLENQSYESAFKIIRASRQMMKGYKGKRFVLDLSFIGWYLLTAITLGIASIYVYPYVYTAQTLFYEAVLKEQDQTPIFY